MSEHDPRIGPVVVSETALQDRIAALGKQISADYDGTPILLIAVLKGAYMFLADLSRAIDVPHEVDFMAVSSYGDSTRSSGVVRIVKDLDIDLAGRHVVLVEDIVDSGLTLRYLQKTFVGRNPASFNVCALLVREGNQRADVELKYVGFEIPPSFVIGYGLDAAGFYRNLPEIREYIEDVPPAP